MIVRTHILIGIDASSILAGARDVMQALIKEIEKRGLQEEIKVLETGSLGSSTDGVVMVVYPEGIYYRNVKPEDVPVIVEEHLLKGRPVKRLMMPSVTPGVVTKETTKFDVSKQPRIVLKNVGIINPESIEEYIGVGGYEALGKALLEMTPQDVIQEIKSSGLRGRGGAGFPTGLKWELAYKAKGSPKYIICNADEGEPGTFKDRLILEGDPHKTIEGMIIAGYAVGANRGYIYVRGEYELSIERLEKALSQAREYGFLGENIFGTEFSFDIYIKKGAGAYICGEETALIESLEGKRGEPRFKPPYPTDAGLWGKPTVINNVETLANVPSIIQNGASWFRSFGTEKSPGTKVYSILGHIVNAGLIEVPMGVTLREIIYGYGGGMRSGKFKIAQIGGTAGALLGEDALDIPMDFDSLKPLNATLGSGAILIMDDSTCIVEVLKSVVAFFKRESCGKCTPCRAGVSKLYNMVNNIHGSGPEIVDKILEISTYMQQTSFCALGQSPIMPVSSAIKYFKDEIIEHTYGECRTGRCHFEEVPEELELVV
ncbi:MAG TPA: NADH-quinone oxidoreductase subunit NuoF [bacterium]|nr:NADH-quinone oxidoreductase subunit NuoF [bacterium]